MSATFLRKLVKYMRATGETESVIDVPGIPEPVTIKLAPPPAPTPQPTAIECAACRAHLRLWSVIIIQPLGKN